MRNTLVDERTQCGCSASRATLYQHGVSGTPEEPRTRARVFLDGLQ
jgi:hypothetical protein